MTEQTHRKGGAIVFFVFGVLNSSGAYIGLGVAFLAIGLTRKTRSRS